MEENGGFSFRARVKLVTMQGSLHAVGVLEGYCPVPQVLIRTLDGDLVWWRADMCEELDEETVRILEAAGVEMDPVRELETPEDS